MIRMVFRYNGESVASGANPYYFEVTIEPGIEGGIIWDTDSSCQKIFLH